jgi:hypothetical protein
MKAGCFYICFQVAEPGEDARCCNIPKLNEEFESFRGPRGEGPQIRQGQDSQIFVLC